jgi:hypothetical protein
MTRRLPSLDVPAYEKHGFSEAEVHSKLFELDMTALGYPPRTRTQGDGAHFQEQGRLALRRLRSRDNRQARGIYDGLYLIGNAPIVLCELKRYDALDGPVALRRAISQLKGYALSEDFAVPPPFLVLYNGRPDKTRFFRLRAMADGSLLDEAAYEELPEIWSWDRVTGFQLRGSFAEEVVDAKRLLEILLDHLDRIEDDLRADVAHAVRLVTAPDPSVELLTRFGRDLLKRPQAFARMRQLYERKVAEIGGDRQAAVAEEMVTQAALNYLNKVFFLNLCEDRNLEGFYRIMREFLPSTRAHTTPTTAAVFLGLLRRRLRDTTGVWSPQDERAYRDLRSELSPAIGEHVIDQNNWWTLIRVAFDLAEERFPLIYREDAYDDFRPAKSTVAELVYDLSTKSFSALTNRHVGDIYQGLLSSRRRGQGRGGARRRQQAKLGAFYTPRPDVEYMTGRLNLTRDSRVLDPCMGSGHFLEGLHERLLGLYLAEGLDGGDAHRRIIGEQLYGGDIDTFATSLAAIRLFLLDEHDTKVLPNLVVHDMLLHSPERPGAELFSPELHSVEGRTRDEAEQAVVGDERIDALDSIDEIRFDAIVGNPPYGARKPEYKRPVYARLYGRRAADLRAGSVATGDADTYAMFCVSGIERLREGGRLCLITNDSFRSVTTHARLRRHILDRCKIVEILLTDTNHFEGVSFQFAGMAITTLEKCSDPVARAEHEVRLVDYIRDPSDFASPPPERVSTLRQALYERLPETPFHVGVPQDVMEAALASERLEAVARGRQGLATADDKRFLAGIDAPFTGLDHVVLASEVRTDLTGDERLHGVPPGRPGWVPFAKGAGSGAYWRPPRVAIDWTTAAIAELERRNRYPAGTTRRPRLQNRKFYFLPGLTYSVVSSGRVTARLLPAGWVFGHKGSAIFVESEEIDELFVLGYLNSALATYFMKKIVNTTATADVGYVEKLPFRRPGPDLHDAVTKRVTRIIEAFKRDPLADVAGLRTEIDEQIFDLFEIGDSRESILRFADEVGRIVPQEESE